MKEKYFEKGSRRDFVKNFGIITTGLSLTHSTSFLVNSNAVKANKFNVVIFGRGIFWTNFKKEIESYADLVCAGFYELDDSSIDKLYDFENQLENLKQTQKIDGILLYFEEHGWEDWALRVVTNNFPVYIEAPLPTNLKSINDLASAVSSSKQVAHWIWNKKSQIKQNCFKPYHGNDFSRLYSHIFSLTFELDQVRPLTLSQIEGCFNNNGKSYHILFHFSLGEKKISWQWMKGDIALNLFGEYSEAIITSSNVEKKGSKRVVVLAKDEKIASKTSQYFQLKESIRVWITQVSRGRQHELAPCITFSKLHFITEILTLKQIILNAFPYYEYGKYTRFQYPDDYLSIPWNSRIARFTKYTDLNNWL